MNICEIYQKLTDEEQVSYPYEVRDHTTSIDGDFVTILRDGDTWESVQFSLRIAIHKRQKFTHDFFEDIIDFLLIRDVDKYEGFIREIMHGSKRLIKHMMGELHY